MAVAKRVESERRRREERRKLGFAVSTQVLVGYSRSQRGMKKGMEAFLGVGKGGREDGIGIGDKDGLEEEHDGEERGRVEMEGVIAEENNRVTEPWDEDGVGDDELLEELGGPAPDLTASFASDGVESVAAAAAATTATTVAPATRPSPASSSLTNEMADIPKVSGGSDEPARQSHPLCRKSSGKVLLPGEKPGAGEFDRDGGKMDGFVDKALRPLSVALMPPPAPKQDAEEIDDNLFEITSDSIIDMFPSNTQLARELVAEDEEEESRVEITITEQSNTFNSSQEYFSFSEEDLVGIAPEVIIALLRHFIYVAGLGGLLMLIRTKQPVSVDCKTNYASTRPPPHVVPPPTDRKSTHESQQNSYIDNTAHRRSLFEITGFSTQDVEAIADFSDSEIENKGDSRWGWLPDDIVPLSEQCFYGTQDIGDDYGYDDHECYCGIY